VEFFSYLLTGGIWGGKKKKDKKQRVKRAKQEWGGGKRVSANHQGGETKGESRIRPQKAIRVSQKSRFSGGVRRTGRWAQNSRTSGVRGTGGHR